MLNLFLSSGDVKPWLEITESDSSGDMVTKVAIVAIVVIVVFVSLAFLMVVTGYSDFLLIFWAVATLLIVVSAGIFTVVHEDKPLLSPKSQGVVEKAYSVTLLASYASHGTDEAGTVIFVENEENYMAQVEVKKVSDKKFIRFTDIQKVIDSTVSDDKE